MKTIQVLLDSSGEPALIPGDPECTVIHWLELGRKNVLKIPIFETLDSVNLEV